MASRLAPLLAVMTVLLALSCGDGGSGGPAVTTAVPLAPSTVTIKGPVLVFASPPQGIVHLEGRPRRHWVRALDTHSGARWTILEYPVQAEVAGTSLVAFDGTEVRRVAMDGSVEMLLWEAPVQDLSVSSDGTKVAILPRSGPRGVVVLDAVTGEELLSVARADPRLLVWTDTELGDRFFMFTLGDWSTDSDAVAIEIDWQKLPQGLKDLWHVPPSLPPERIATLTLDGDLSKPPEYSRLSPDFRHAIRTEYPIGSTLWDALWGRFEVIEAATDEVLWKVTATDGAGIIPHEVLAWSVLGHPERVLWTPNAKGYVYFEYHPPSRRAGDTSRALNAWLEWVAGNAPEHLSARVLDIETGESRLLPHAEWIGDAGERVDEVCGSFVPRSTCVLLLKGSTVFNNERNFVGLIELDEPHSLSVAPFLNPCRWPGDC